MDWLKYKFRASQVGKLFSSKGDLTVTNKKALIEIYVQETIGFKKDITNKFWEKGVACEPEGRDLIQQLHPDVFIPKNTIRKENEYVTGEWDVYFPDLRLVYDIKCAWDYLSFNNSELSVEYEWQLRCYMWLLSANKARLAYCLCDTPENILVAEYNRMKWKNGFLDDSDPVFVAMREDFEKLHTFSHLPIEQRMRIWEIEHDESKIEVLKSRLDKCRQWLKEYHEQQLKHQNNVLEIIKQSYEEIENQNTQAELF